MLGQRSFIGRVSWGDRGEEESTSASAPDQELLESAPYPVFRSSEVPPRELKVRGGCCGSGAPDCNTLEGTHSSMPGACLGAYNSAGRAVWRLPADRRGLGRMDLYGEQHRIRQL